MDSSTDWLLRIGDGKHFLSSRSKHIWGVNSNHISWVPNFLREIKPGDRIWFIKSGCGGKVVGVATFVRHCPREIGPLIAVTFTNEELGWTESSGEWDTEIHYTQLYDVSECELYTNIKSPLVGRKYNPLKCTINLPETYRNIVQFSKALLV